MNDRLKTIVDLENYPINDLSSEKIQNLIKKWVVIKKEAPAKDSK